MTKYDIHPIIYLMTKFLHGTVPSVILISMIKVSSNDLVVQDYIRL